MLLLVSDHIVINALALFSDGLLADAFFFFLVFDLIQNVLTILGLHKDSPNVHPHFRGNVSALLEIKNLHLYILF